MLIRGEIPLDMLYLIRSSPSLFDFSIVFEECILRSLRLHDLLHVTRLLMMTLSDEIYFVMLVEGMILTRGAIIIISITLFLFVLVIRFVIF